MVEFFRQGDVLLEKIDMVNNNCIAEESRTILNTKIIAYGEETGHSHFFDETINNNQSSIVIQRN